MKRVFKTRHFSRWMRKTELTNHVLCHAVAEMVQELVDADLGGGIVKKRVGLAGRGCAAVREPWLRPTRVIDGFSSSGSRKMNGPISQTTNFDALQEIATQLLARTGQQLDEAVKDGSLQEICDDDKNEG